MFAHELGVCVKSMQRFTDWRLVVQFALLWRRSGATRVLAYYTSATKQVLAVVKVRASGR